MKLPKDIVGKNKLRDLYICELYIKGMMPEQIQEALANSTHPIRVSRISKIISANAAYVNPRIGWSKSKRLHRLQRLADLNQDKLSSKKDTIDIMVAIKNEMEGDKSHNVIAIQNYVIVRHPQALQEEIETKSRIINANP